MYLSKLEIFGFKSFAQKTVFKFEDGLTGIIGPNGCGKSNIVDAIRWVLGEQRPSVLRCEKMENLIFNGTATRKPLNVADISISIQNNKQVLPSEYTEIKITRRLYRFGDSEYLINNQNVRLMDIINLFADTGMGADAYSVIELKMVEQILNENAQERRRLFEEAAGIKKYKTRRKSALNKLEITEQELTRLEDIISEVQRSVNSLARQVGKARRYHEIKQQLQENELILSYLKINSFQNELGPLQSELQQVSHSREVLGKEVHVGEAELEKLQAQFVDLEQQYREAATSLHRKDEAIQELQNRRQLRVQKIDSLEEAIGVFRQELESQKQKIQQLAEEKTLLNEQIRKNQADMNTAQEIYREAANRHMEAEMQHQKMRDEYQEFVQANFQELQQSSALREDYQKIRLEKNNLREQLSKRESSLARLSGELTRVTEELQRTEKALKELLAEQDTCQQELQQLESTIDLLKETQDALREEINLEAGKLEKLRNKKEFLENLISNYEGFSQSVQYIMSQKSRYQGIVDTLANLVDCQPEYRTALESYLAEISNYLVVEETDTAREILTHLRAEEKGRLTVVPLPLLDNRQRSNVAARAAAEFSASTNGVPKALREVVSYPDSYQVLFNFLFDSVYLVRDIDEAIELRDQYPHFTYVTPEGEILESWGNLTGGTVKQELGLVGRKEHYQKLSSEHAMVAAQWEAKKQSLEETVKALQQNTRKLQELAERQRSYRDQVIEMEKQGNHQRYEIDRLQESCRDFENEIDIYRENLQRSEEQEQFLQPQIRELEEKIAAYQTQEKALLEKLQKAEAQLREYTRNTQEHQIAYLNFCSQEKELNQTFRYLEQGIAEAEDYIGTREQRIMEHQGQIKELEADSRQIAAELEIAYKDRDATEQQKNDFEKHFQEMRSVIHSRETELKQKQRLWNQARERVQELELRIRELEVKLSGLKEQVAEKYGSQALNFDIKELDPSYSIHDLQTRNEELRQKFDGLGDVNPLAIKEHDKEKERLDFLNTQKMDLLAARDQLLETIDKLNTTARRQFMETLEKIRKNFQSVFREFFEGGSAELRLVESRDPLEANIDISIIHKGRKLNTLSLLSAGEKTLTAISLLFAIYLVKPSPFCILDEVDAPLDDVNIGNYTRALKRFAKDTQFIIVTHNKKTMESTNSIYGITMEEPGVSRVVSVRFD